MEKSQRDAEACRLLSRDELVEECKKRGILLGTTTFDSDGKARVYAKILGDDAHRLARGAPKSVRSNLPCPVGGIHLQLTDLSVSTEVLHALSEELQDDTSDVRRLSMWPIERSFVYVDVSDFSKFSTGEQLLVVSTIQRYSEDVHNVFSMGESLEAKLCIGDGYIFVFTKPEAALLFACCLALHIESTPPTDPSALEFHFRMGVHHGEVNCFWDGGRDDWNYMGDGIVGGKRVLDAGGKNVDDVVYLSVQAERAIRSWQMATERVLPNLVNIGRREDKHGEMWRIYQVNHSTVANSTFPCIADALRRAAERIPG